MKTEKTFLKANCLQLAAVFLLVLFWVLNASGQSGDSPPPPVSPINPYEGGGNVVDFEHGRISFTQAGKETTWNLSSGPASLDQGAKHMSLKYSPDGKAGKIYLSIGIGEKGSGFAVSSLRIKEGPAGSAEFNKKTGACNVRVTTFSASGVEGSGSCTGEFKGGPAIRQFQFSAKP